MTVVNPDLHGQLEIAHRIMRDEMATFHPEQAFPYSEDMVKNIVEALAQDDVATEVKLARAKELVPSELKPRA